LAKVIDTPANPTLPHVPKRTVRIGPLPQGRVDDGTIARIFGSKMSAVDGNNVLRILHHRRTAGSLADYGVDNLGKQYTHVNRNTAMKGLEWLRQKYPIDEARAAEEWAEREANRIQYELWLADPETESKYKDPARAFKKQMEKEEEDRQQQERDEQKMGILHVGKSQFELNIEQKRRQRLEDIARLAEEKEQREKEMEEKLATGEYVRTPTGTQLMKPGQTTYVDVFGREQVSRRKEEAERYQKQSQTEFASVEEMLSKTTLVNTSHLLIIRQVTNTTQAQRLYPMTAFVLVTVLLCYGFAHYYLPPSPSYRLFPDLSPTTATIGALVILNGVVALAWRVMPLWPLMTRYFMHVPGYPRAVQSVLNVFSHIQYEHFLANMMMFLLVGPVCHDLVGRGTFLGTYISAGAVGTLASLYWANLGRGNISAHSVGASAAIWGIAALYCLLTDQEKIKIPFMKDSEGVSFWPKMLFVAFVLFEIRTAVARKTTMDHASHFGGMAIGAGTAGYLRATGFHEKKAGLATGVQEKAQVDSKTVDVGAIAREGMKEVKESLGKKTD
jgi:rhomboid-like protein